MSRTGLYFFADVNQQPGTIIHFEVELPAPPGGKAGPVIRGRGRLVRREDLGNNRVGLAATIERLKIQRGSEQDVRESLRKGIPPAPPREKA